MYTFTDGDNRRWTFSVNVLTVKRVKEQTGIDLLTLADPASDTFEKLSSDVVALCEVMVSILDDQLRAAGVDAEDFLRTIDNEEIVRNATRACLDAILSFSPTPKAKLMKAALGKLWTATEKREQLEIEKASELILSDRFDAIAEQAVDEAILGRLSSASPPGPVSSRGITPSVN